MTHALRQHCGSFLYDNIRREWGDWETSTPDKAKPKCKTPSRGAVTDMEGEQMAIRVKCAPKEWPLFSAPGLSSMRVVGCKEKGGTLVSGSIELVLTYK